MDTLSEMYRKIAGRTMVEKKLRRLLLEAGEEWSDVALMSLNEACGAALKHYSCVALGDVEILLVKKEDMDEFEKLVKRIW